MKNFNIILAATLLLGGIATANAGSSPVWSCTGKTGGKNVTVEIYRDSSAKALVAEVMKGSAVSRGILLQEKEDSEIFSSYPENEIASFKMKLTQVSPDDKKASAKISTHYQSGSIVSELVAFSLENLECTKRN